MKCHISKITEKLGWKRMLEDCMQKFALLQTLDIVLNFLFSSFEDQQRFDNVEIPQTYSMITPNLPTLGKALHMGFLTPGIRCSSGGRR